MRLRCRYCGSINHGLIRCPALARRIRLSIALQTAAVLAIGLLLIK